MDLYARETKRGGAWMDDAITRRKKRDHVQNPVAYLNCNFSRPVGGKPALFTHDEVLTLFHEFGTAFITCSPASRISAYPASTGWNGTRSSCRASSWRTFAGSGTCCAK